MDKSQPTQRFSSRVENYVRFRPRYPEAVVGILRKECGLEPTWTIADIGSGTGFLAELFLKNGNSVIGVEPNQAMREAGDCFLRDYPKFTSLEGTAEATLLPDNHVEMIIAGQAFHWFDPEKTHAEFKRILVPNGTVALIWNMRRIDDDPVQRDYEDLLLRFGTDYAKVGFQHSVDEDAISRFFTNGWRVREAENVQTLDREGFEGRLLSASYTPEADSAEYRPMLDALGKIFDRHESGGEVTLRYWTKVYLGKA